MARAHEFEDDSRLPAWVLKRPILRRRCIVSALISPVVENVSASVGLSGVDTSRARSCVVGDLGALDVNHRVTFSRLPSDTNSRRRVSGRLKRIRDVDYLVGNIRRAGVELVVAFPLQNGGESSDVYGPLPLTYPVDVGDPMLICQAPIG